MAAVPSDADLPDVPDDLFPSPKPKSDINLPLLWFGIPFRVWISLLIRYRFRVSPGYWPRAVFITLLSLVNSFVSSYTALLYARRIARAKVTAPLFVVGHWRSGTTLLHELLAKDPKNAWPDGYACFCPAHFQRSRYIVRGLSKVIAPRQRPMDFMTFDLALPQEDEFALLMTGAPSPYEELMFPFAADETLRRLEPASLTPAEQARFDRKMRRFFRAVMAEQAGRRLVLKSPPHLGRLETLARLYPDLKVLHIVRDPRAVVPSMAKMIGLLGPMGRMNRHWPANSSRRGFMRFRRMFELFEETRHLVPEGSLVEIRYEDLIADPVTVLRRVYADLDLGDFGPLEAALTPLVEGGHFRPAKPPELTAQQSKVIEAYCGPMMRRYGYL